MMTSKETVRRAIARTGPGRLPLLFGVTHQEKSDILGEMFHPADSFHPPQANIDEWGIEWESLDQTLGQPKNTPLASWDMLSSYAAPDPNAAGRYDHLRAFVGRNADKYLMATLGISGFNRTMYIRGYENTMEDLYLNRDRIEQLLDMVFSFETEVIKNYGRFGIDAVSFFDDWGMQESLMISPELWREMFKPRYRRQFDLAHRLGMHVYFHCCGNIYSIIGDLVEIGADVLNLNQPDLLGIERMGKDFGGRVCFNCPVDHQRLALDGSRDEIFSYVKRLYENLGCFNGGFIGLIEDYRFMGQKDESYENIVEAFECLNKERHS
ncbi:MAG: uroporphyrinogen decarboxylase family protein [Victivallales bacterium]